MRKISPLFLSLVLIVGCSPSQEVKMRPPERVDNIVRIFMLDPYPYIGHHFVLYFESAPGEILLKDVQVTEQIKFMKDIPKNQKIKADVGEYELRYGQIFTKNLVIHIHDESEVEGKGDGERRRGIDQPIVIK